MPFPYVPPSDFKRELAYSHEDADIAESEWNALIEDKLKQESARVDRWTDESWRADGANVPFVIHAAVIRLTRSVINQIEEDGLSSESVGDHNESYRPPGDVREEIRGELGEAGYGDENVASLRAPSVR